MRTVLSAGRHWNSSAAKYSASRLFSVNVTLELPPPTCWLLPAKAAHIKKSLRSVFASV